MLSKASLHLQMENLKQTHHLTPIPKEDWPEFVVKEMKSRPIEAWRSREFLVQIYIENGFERLTAMRSEITPQGKWKDGISWDELQRLKFECGRGDRWAVECYPPDSEVVNVNNLRHLWLLPSAPEYGWRKK